MRLSPPVAHTCLSSNVRRADCGQEKVQPGGVLTATATWGLGLTGVNYWTVSGRKGGGR